MERFAAGQADVLVATTVIEVGIDVPNATVMLVEDAERYGISQLHQLRGRIGRGEHASLCLLFGPKESARLKALAEHTDGFRLAEIDLELRGEGELTGTRQSGLARFRFARLPDDAELLERAHGAALDLLAADPELAEHEDGFRLAEIDLELRGEGDMLGTRQSGLPAFRFARLPEDVELLQRARHRALAILDADPELAAAEHALLVAAMGAEALEPIPA